MNFYGVSEFASPIDYQVTVGVLFLYILFGKNIYTYPLYL